MGFLSLPEDVTRTPLTDQQNDPSYQSSVSTALSNLTLKGNYQWIAEPLTPSNVCCHAVKKVLFDAKSQFHHVKIVDTGSFGRALFLDDEIQTTEGDECFYHEPIVHLPCLFHGAPKSALVIGGADGGSIRELLRWRTIESITMVDIDQVAVDACKKFLPSLSRGAFDHPKCTILFDDGMRFVSKTNRKFDVIICDISDPGDDGHSVNLFSVEFFTILKRILTPNGTISLMAGITLFQEGTRVFPRTYATVSSVFNYVRPAQVFVPTYGAPVGILVASEREPILKSAEEYDAILHENVHGHFQVLDGNSVRGHFAIPLCLQRALKKETEVFTLRKKAKSLSV